jgi:hypothetical protein
MDLLDGIQDSLKYCMEVFETAVQSLNETKRRESAYVCHLVQEGTGVYVPTYLYNGVGAQGAHVLLHNPVTRLRLPTCCLNLVTSDFRV